MPIYEYKAYAPGGSTKAGIIDADTERDARHKLRRDQLHVHSLKEVRGGKRRKKSKSGKAEKKEGLLKRAIEARASKQGPGAKESEIIGGVTRQMATLLGSGIPLADTLTAIVDQAEKAQRGNHVPPNP